jgi:hypothetical protein
MSNIFDWSQHLLGVQNPEDELAQWSDEQQRQNRAATGYDPNDPNAAAKTNAVAQANAASTLPQDQEPNATKTPASLGHIMVDLQRYNERKQTFDSSLGGMFAAVSQPRDRPMMEHAFDVNLPDPTKWGESLMNLSSQQQGQDRANSIATMVNDPVQGPKIAAQLHMDWTALKAGMVADPGMVGKIATALGTPTGNLQDLTQIQEMQNAAAQIKSAGGTDQDISDLTTAMKAKIAGPDAMAMVGAQMAWRKKYGNTKPMPWTPNDSASFKQFQANEAQKEDDRSKASDVLAKNQNQAEELRGNLETLRDSPGMQSILSNSAKRTAAIQALNNPNTIDVETLVAKGTLNRDEANAVALLGKIKGGTYGEALHSLVGTGTRVTQQEAGPLAASISTVTNLNQDYAHYVHGAINPLITRVKRTVANAIGATGNLRHMDPEYEPWLHPIYRKDGELYKEGGGADAIPDLGPVPADALAAAKKEALAYPVGKDDVLDGLQQQGFNVDKLRRINPSSW